MVIVSKFSKDDRVIDLDYQIVNLKKSLDQIILDSAEKTSECNSQFLKIAQITLKEMSDLASKLSASLIRTKSTKKHKLLNELTNNLGNLQFKLNKIIISVNQTNKLILEIKEEYSNTLNKFTKSNE